MPCTPPPPPRVEGATSQLGILSSSIERLFAPCLLTITHYYAYIDIAPIKYS